MKPPVGPETPPTARQLEILAWWGAYSAEHGYAPTLREARRHFGLGSTYGVKQHLQSLAKRGLVKEPPVGVARGYVLTDEGRAELAK